MPRAAWRGTSLRRRRGPGTTEREWGGDVMIKGGEGRIAQCSTKKHRQARIASPP